MKAVRLFYIVLFFAVSLIPLFAMPFYKNSSGSEKRNLNQMPKAVENSRINTGFFSQFNDYFSDHFAYRLEMAQLNELIYTKSIGFSVNEKVIYGRDGWLYFHETIPDYTGQTAFTDSDIERLVTTLSLQSEYLEQKGIRYIFTVAPNKNTVYPEHMPKRIRKTEKPTVLERLTDALASGGVNYTDLSGAIINAKSGGNLLYHKTDTHWNDLGARAAANRLMEDIKSILPGFAYDDFRNAETTETTSAGDLKKMLLPLSKTANEGRTSLNFKKLYTAQKPFRSVEDVKITTTSGVNQARIMMFRDSFGNAVIPFLSNNFGYAFYSKEYPVNFGDIETHAPDVVVYEIAQRNIPKIIEKAPVMPAVKRKLELPDARNAEGRLFTGRKGELIHIYGYLETGIDTAYRCYLTDSGGQTWEGFPILEAGKLDGVLPQSKGYAGFSLYLKKADMNPGHFKVTMDFLGTSFSHDFAN